MANSRFAQVVPPVAPAPASPQTFDPQTFGPRVGGDLTDEFGDNDKKALLTLQAASRALIPAGTRGDMAPPPKKSYPGDTPELIAAQKLYGDVLNNKDAENRPADATKDQRKEAYYYLNRGADQLKENPQLKDQVQSWVKKQPDYDAKFVPNSAKMSGPKASTQGFNAAP